MKVNAVLYFRVVDPNKAVTEVEDFMYATSQLAQTTLRSILGMNELDDLLSDRERINTELQNVLDTHTDPWGIKVTAVEVKHVDLPQEMQRAMAKQAEAERERARRSSTPRARPRRGEAIEAATVMEAHPIALQLRYLQTLREVPREQLDHAFPVPAGGHFRIS